MAYESCRFIMAFSYEYDEIFFSQILENILITNVLKEIRRKHKSDKKYKMQDDANL